MSVKGVAVSGCVNAPVRPIIIQDLLVQNKRKPQFLIFKRNRENNVVTGTIINCEKMVFIDVGTSRCYDNFH